MPAPSFPKGQGARAEVSRYPEAVKHIVARIVRGRGMAWSIVKLCVDNAIEAEAAIANYGREHDSLMEKCKTEFAYRGAARIKACVDQAIATDRSHWN